MPLSKIYPHSPSELYCCIPCQRQTAGVCVSGEEEEEGEWRGGGGGRKEEEGKRRGGEGRERDCCTSASSTYAHLPLPCSRILPQRIRRSSHPVGTWVQSRGSASSSFLCAASPWKRTSACTGPEGVCNTQGWVTVRTSKGNKNYSAPAKDNSNSIQCHAKYVHVMSIQHVAFVTRIFCHRKSDGCTFLH